MILTFNRVSKGQRTSYLNIDEKLRIRELHLRVTYIKLSRRDNYDIELFVDSIKIE